MSNPAPDRHASTGASANDASWLVRKGETGALVAAYAWETTPLGALSTWPVHLRTVANHVLEGGAAMALIWGKDHTFLYNDAYAKIIQNKHPAALGSSLREGFPEIWDSLSPLVEQAMSGEAVVIDDYSFNLTRNGVTATGYFSFSYNPIRNEVGHVEGFVAVVVESTVRVAAEKERYKVFDTVLSAINDFAYTFDLSGRFLYVNKALLDLWGLSLEQAVGKDFFDLKYPDDLAARLQRQIQEVIANKIVVRDETRYVSPSGVEGFYEYIFSPVFGPDGAVTIVAGSTRDITRRKKLEMDLVASSQAKDDFLATLSHELRTPLNPVLLLATEAANNSSLPPEVRDDFRSIAHNISMEARLIDDLLDISRIAHGKLPLNPVPLEIHPLLDLVLDSLVGDCMAKELRITKKWAAGRLMVVGDELRLHQLFSNVLRNAVKFTPKGGSVTVITRIEAGSSPTLQIEVIDSGIGMTTDELVRVFDPFSQGDHSEAGAGFGGLGLGLAISRKIAELHSGSITANSSGRNEGSSFLIKLPLHSSGLSAAPFAGRALRSEGQKNAMGKLKVLLVEDHYSSRAVLARLLTSRKMEVVQAGSAAEALKEASRSAFDLVISDIGLPDMDGYQLMKQLRDDYGCRGIALSGFGTQEDIDRSREAGFFCHLTKPVQMEALDEALDRFIDG
ncbi:MAG: ATP-binding protein [Lacunisphaera sp.]